MVDKAIDNTYTVSDVLRAFASALQTPVIVILIICIALAVFLAGWTISEAFTERRKLKVDIPSLLDKVRASSLSELPAVIEESGLLSRQKKALTELTLHPDFTPLMREALAVNLLGREKAKYDRRVKHSEILSRVAPMFGLMGTLIPLGPGIVALGQGDTFTLSNSLLIAFDTTVTGLAVAVVALIITSIRRSWYAQYLKDLDTVAECILEMEKAGGDQQC